MEKLQATAPKQRIHSLDILRGFALLGILIMNIISYSMVGANYLNPFAQGELSQIDEWAFVFSQLFANQKFISLFSILFGAGVVLLTDRIEKKGMNAASRHYRRNFWLLLIGLVHAYCFWYGDILVSYAICAFWLYFFRKLSVKSLLIWAAFFFIVSSVLSLFFGFTMPYWPEAEKLNTCLAWVPNEAAILQETKASLGTWFEQASYRIPQAFFLQTFIFLQSLAWQITGLMLLGMALFKSRVLHAERSDQFYKRMLSFGSIIGISLSILGLCLNYSNDWSCEYSFFIGNQFNYWGSVPMCLAYIAIIMLLCRSKWMPYLDKFLAPVGRMALTNYLMQSIICGIIFYGHGFGLFGQVGRANQFIFVLVIWLFQIIFSRWWLRHFKFGPFEWFWRSLTYWKFQKMK